MILIIFHAVNCINIEFLLYTFITYRYLITVVIVATHVLSRLREPSCLRQAVQ